MKDKALNTTNRIIFSSITIITSVLVSLVLMGCGPNYESDYKDERQQRISTQEQLDDTKGDVTDLSTFLKNLKLTTNYAWIYRGNVVTHDETKNAYNAALKSCQDLGYELPTLEMATEAETNPELKQIMYAKDGSRHFIVVDQPSGVTTFLLICAKRLRPA
jgi:hypothetical protein